VTLTGRVLPIGGVKEKLLGAYRAGIKTIVLPKENEADLEDLPAEVTPGAEIHPVDTIDEALAVALEGASEAKPSPELTGLPDIPFVDGVLAIEVVYPAPGTSRPNADSVLVYGSVGTGLATLTINGSTVRVESNGSFLGYLPRPASDTLHLVAWVGDHVTEARRWYEAPGPTSERVEVVTVTYPTPRQARVVGGDTLATGSDVTVGRSTPAGTYRWFLPAGARLSLTGERGDLVRASLDGVTEGWFPATELVIEEGGPTSIDLAPPRLTPSEAWTDVRFAIDAAPFRIEAMDSVLQVTLHGVAGDYFRMMANDRVVRLVEWHPASGDATVVRIHPAHRIWGFKAFYDDEGGLVVRIRPPPPIDPVEPLRGVRIAVDPGHPPAGATGPTGFPEAEANLAIGASLAEQLRERGADVLITRTTGAELGLTDRTNMAVEWDAHVLVSVHNNAFPEGVDPYARNGTSTYYFHPMAIDLARTLNSEIAATTTARDLGVIHGNLALARPTWMPSVLTESLFMPIPEHEAALRDSGFVERLAAAHVRGLESFLRLAAARGSHQ
jgi:N-acetylmuramoyl-L-alanine amidase